MVAVHPENPIPQEFVAETGERYEHVRKVAKAYGAEFLVWQPILWVETGAIDPQVKAQERELSIMGATFSKVRENFATTYGMLAGSLKDKPYVVEFRKRASPSGPPRFMRLTGST